MIIAKSGIEKFSITKILSLIVISATLMNAFPLYAGAAEERAMAVDKISCPDDIARCVGILATGSLSLVSPLLLRFPLGILSFAMNGYACRALYSSITNGDRDPALAGVASKKMGGLDMFSRACGTVVTGVLTGIVALSIVGNIAAMINPSMTTVPSDVNRKMAIVNGIFTVLLGYNCRALSRNLNGDNEIE